ncbi:MAG: CDP-alcohol phosphatidyltransferase family protein [Gemmatimonadetes bacterium]|nr:CDP-alcohol phosphatidyltransferase family protein [Gemmatimonadota bacterium]
MPISTALRMLVYRNIPNITSILGVVPLAILFLEDGFRYLLPLIVYNNIMDDLDGMLAAKLNLKSEFGAALDNVCDAVAHILIVMAVGMHYGGLCALLSLVAVVSIMLRVVSRLTPIPKTGVGSPTNELMRHILFVLVVAQYFELAVEPLINMAFVLNAVSMQVSYPLVFSIRSLMTSPAAIGLANVALAAAWLVPVTALPIGACFAGTYLYSLVAGAVSWIKRS